MFGRKAFGLGILGGRGGEGEGRGPMLVTLGFSELSRKTLDIISPSGPIVSMRKLLATYVASPSCAAKCLANAVALLSNFCTSLDGATHFAPALARISTNLFARQSVMVKRCPLGSCISPTARIER